MNRRALHGSHPRLKSAGFRPADSIGIRHAYCRTNNSITRTEHLCEVCTRRPPCVGISAVLPLCPSVFQVAVVREGQHVPPPPAVHGTLCTPGYLPSWRHEYLKDLYLTSCHSGVDEGDCL